MSVCENPLYLSQQIITYIGNKRALLPFIEKGLIEAKETLGLEKIRFLDLFSGTGIVSRMARKHAHALYCNDLEHYSFVTNQCYQTNLANIDNKALERAFEYVDREVTNNFSPGFIAELYAPADDDNIQPGERVFYTRYNAIFLDSLCRALMDIPQELRPFILAPILAQASMYANTSGVFKGFYKNDAGVGQFGGRGNNALSRIKRKITLIKPILSRNRCEAHIYREDANRLIDHLPHVDIAYFDPPYNQHPYGSNYFMLNLLCDYRRPKDISPVGGIPRQWNRSFYNKARQAHQCLFDAIKRVKASFVLISYNSEGFVKKDQFLRDLSSLGKVKVMDKKYNAFRGSRNLSGRERYVTEHLFLLDKRA